MITDITRALGQLGDQRFRKVLGIGLGLTILLLVGFYGVLFGLIQWFVPDVLTLPFIGEIQWVDTFLSVASLFLMIVLSAFLMIPVASAFTSLFLDEVADAVEDIHYPHLPQAPRANLSESVNDSLHFLGVLIAANLLALIPYLLMPPAAPLIFLAMNGFLLGREYFQLVAMRRLGRKGAKEARRRHAGAIWLTGIVMALPLTIPILNLLVPILGAATFTHLFHRLERVSATP